jgi:NADH-quinone oxidoreductase subunit C
MTPIELLEKIKTKVEIISSKEDLGVLNAEVGRESLQAALRFLKDQLSFDWMSYMTALDWPAAGRVETIYELFSNETKDRCVIRVKLDRANPVIDTASGIYRAADWHERETAEMFGIKFQGHPDPRRLITIDGMDAPLRKDFTDPGMKKLPV